MTNRQDTEGTGYDPGVEAPTAPTPEKASLFEDFIDVFYAPSKVYSRRHNRSFWPYFWILSIVSALFMFASRGLMSAVFDVENSRRMAQMMAENPQFTQEMAEQGRAVTGMITNVVIYLGMPMVILGTAILTWLVSKIVKAKVSWGAALLIASIAQIPRLLGGLLTTVQGLMIDVTTITGAHQITYSPARFMASDTSQPLLGLLSRFDLFILWVTVLLGIGIAVVGKVPRAKGYLAAAIAWVISSLAAIWAVVTA